MAGVVVGTAVLMSIVACSGRSPHAGAVAASSGPALTGSATPASAAASPVLRGPTRPEIFEVLRRTVEVGTPGENFVTLVQAPKTISDGRGGTLTAVLALRHPSADGKGMLVFFWHNHTFLGWDSHKEAIATSAPAAAGPGAFRVTYADYAKKDAVCCPTLPSIAVIYHWKPGGRFVANRAIPPGVYGLNNRYAHALTVKLR